MPKGGWRLVTPVDVSTTVGVQARARAIAEGESRMSAAGKRHMARVAQLPCILCGAQPVEVHHIREGQGTQQRAQDTLVLPLCVDHHRGPNGIHGLGRKGFYSRYKMDELDLLAATLERLA